MWVITVDKHPSSLDMRPGQCLSGVAPKYGEGERGGEREGAGCGRAPNYLITQITADVAWSCSCRYSIMVDIFMAKTISFEDDD